jgi:hypothetical protein
LVLHRNGPPVLKEWLPFPIYESYKRFVTESKVPSRPLNEVDPEELKVFENIILFPFQFEYSGPNNKEDVRGLGIPKNI